MATLKDILPDLSDLNQSLKIARRAIRKDDEDAGLKDKLWLTCAVVNDAVVYRPYAAARSWLAANPRWLEKATGREGGEWRSLDLVLAGLDADQAKLDALLGLLPAAPEPETSATGAPGPEFTSWR